MSDRPILVEADGPLSSLGQGEAPSPEQVAEVFRDPLQTALAFLGGLEGAPSHVRLLPALVAPETAAEWGDFTAASRRLRELGSTALEALGRSGGSPSDVVHFQLLRRDGDTLTRSAAAVLTLVWSPASCRWLVQRFEEPPASVEGSASLG